jgi:hypothetical protein
MPVCAVHWTTSSLTRVRKARGLEHSLPESDRIELQNSTNVVGSGHTPSVQLMEITLEVLLVFVDVFVGEFVEE